MTFVYAVGKPYSAGKTRWPEAVEYNFRAGSHELRLFINQLTAPEIEAIRNGDCEFAIYVDGPILFFLYRFDGFGPWSDAPYSWHLVKEKLAAEATLPEKEDSLETRALLNVVLVEASTGIIKALRAVTLSPEFTRQLHTAIRDQASIEWVGGTAYDIHHAFVYEKFKRSEDMVKAAQARTKGGE